MNKLMGLLELREIDIPTIPWKWFKESVVLDERLLWTVRTAVAFGPDLSLPRAVGVTALEATRKGAEFQQKYRDSGMVIYYPYFIAEKSGVVNISSNGIVIEAVKGDLWNLITYGRKNVAISIDCGQMQTIGETDFLTEEELQQLHKEINIIKGRYRQELGEGQTLLLEWSFAYNTDISRVPVGEKYLVFYEIRTT